MEYDQNTLKRLNSEVEKERKVQAEKKRQEKEYFNKMIAENKKN